MIIEPEIYWSEWMGT